MPKKQATACLGCDRGFLVVIKCRKCQEHAIAGFGSRQGIHGPDIVLFCSVSRQEVMCLNMVLRF